MDWVEGYVTRVVDGDTFVMNVKWFGADNRYGYKGIEKIRVAGIDKPSADGSKTQPRFYVNKTLSFAFSQRW